MNHIRQNCRFAPWWGIQGVPIYYPWPLSPSHPKVRVPFMAMYGSDSAFSTFLLIRVFYTVHGLSYDRIQGHITVQISANQEINLPSALFCLLLLFSVPKKPTHCKYVLIYFIALFKESKKEKSCSIPFFSWVCVCVNTILTVSVEGAVLWFLFLFFLSLLQSFLWFLRRLSMCIQATCHRNTLVRMVTKTLTVDVTDFGSSFYHLFFIWCAINRSPEFTM